MPFRNILLLIAGSFCLGFAIAAEPARNESPLAKAKRLAVSEKREDRIQALRCLKALAQPGTTSGDEATCRYADLCLRFHTEGEKTAIEEARVSFEKLAKGAGSRFGLRGKIGLWRVMALEGKRKQAIKGLDRFLGQQTKCERAVEAAFFLGSVFIAAGKKTDLANLRNAQRALSYSLKLYAAVGKYTPPIIAKKTIQAKLAWVKRRLWELAAGKLKVLFTKAEKLRKARKYDSAIKVYRQTRKEFPGHDLTELSGLRIPECYFGKKDLKKAVSEAREFIARDPLGAYRGHAHLLIGDIHLEHLFDVAGCEPEFRCILDPKKARPRWVDTERQNLIAYRKVNPKKTPPAKEVHKSWKKVLHSAHERVGILEYLRRDYKKAISHFEKSAALKPDHSYGQHAGQGMADLADRIRAKREIVPPIMLAERAERPKLVLLLASIYMQGWRDDRALGLLRRVVRGEFKDASLNQKAYAHVKIAEGLFYKRKDKEAIKVLKKFERSPYCRTRFAARALLQLAVVANRKDGVEECIKYLTKAHARDPNSEWGQLALYQKAYVYYATERPAKALKFFNEYAARHPDSFEVTNGNVEYFTEKLKKELAAKRQKDKQK